MDKEQMPYSSQKGCKAIDNKCQLMLYFDLNVIKEKNDHSI
jgi:hypothetical protein